ncbi:hypothetical protein I316_05936 [Kwoniella heveanensis BCC8398]|uniref:Uncharacterized protein n=1 Tax=Kwoniella heveanensis BCC8398 TaxID=1296120 RepID=A0A1B9GNB4_9TREE|nr:hypothetical protein I316_05936 [Kwoniella heveanensis BCC8398]
MTLNNASKTSNRAKDAIPARTMQRPSRTDLPYRVPFPGSSSPSSAIEHKSQKRRREVDVPEEAEEVETVEMIKVERKSTRSRAENVRNGLGEMLASSIQRHRADLSRLKSRVTSNAMRTAMAQAESIALQTELESTRRELTAATARTNLVLNHNEWLEKERRDTIKEWTAKQSTEIVNPMIAVGDGDGVGVGVGVEVGDAGDAGVEAGKGIGASEGAEEGHGVEELGAGGGGSRTASGQVNEKSKEPIIMPADTTSPVQHKASPASTIPLPSTRAPPALGAAASKLPAVMSRLNRVNPQTTAKAEPTVNAKEDAIDSAHQRILASPKVPAASISAVTTTLAADPPAAATTSSAALPPAASASAAPPSAAPDPAIPPDPAQHIRFHRARTQSPPARDETGRLQQPLIRARPSPPNPQPAAQRPTRSASPVDELCSIRNRIELVKDEIASHGNALVNWTADLNTKLDELRRRVEHQEVLSKKKNEDHEKLRKQHAAQKDTIEALLKREKEYEKELSELKGKAARESKSSVPSRGQQFA